MVLDELLSGINISVPKGDILLVLWKEGEVSVDGVSRSSNLGVELATWDGLTGGGLKELKITVVGNPWLWEDILLEGGSVCGSWVTHGVDLGGIAGVNLVLNESNIKELTNILGLVSDGDGRETTLSLDQPCARVSLGEVLELELDWLSSMALDLDDIWTTLGNLGWASGQLEESLVDVVRLWLSGGILGGSNDWGSSDNWSLVMSWKLSLDG